MSSSGGHPRDLFREMYHGLIPVGAMHTVAQGLQGFQRFFYCSYAPGCLQEAVLPQAHHPLALGDAAYLTSRGLQQDHLPDLVGYHHQLVDPGPPPVAAPATPAAAYSLVEVQAFRGQPERELHPFQDLAFDLDGLLAPLAELPDKPLGDNTIYGRGGEVRLHAHVGKAAQGPGSVVGVQRGQYQMARQGRLDTDLGRVLVAYLAYHHDVGIGAQDVPQAGGEGQADLGVDLHLVEAWYLVLDGVLDGYDVLLRGVQLLEGCVERRGLTRAGRSRNQGGPVRPAEDCLETLVVPLPET